MSGRAQTRRGLWLRGRDNRLVVYFLREIRLASFAAVGALILIFYFSSVQVYSVLALPVLALTDGRKGWIQKPWQKMVFYAFYPAHFVLLHFAGLLR
ncbi:MAG: hypothetical protein IKR26_07215 [Lachnospiraceae bacterium]|nr:hypothetical protein [Lachnospiraceae bacterium]